MITFVKQEEADVDQIRFHGKHSGLHLLNKSSRKDDRNEGGIWCALDPSSIIFHLLKGSTLIKATSYGTGMAAAF